MNSVEEFLSATPTKVPVVPKPTLTVAIPMRSSFIFAIKNCSPFVNVVPIPALLSSSTYSPVPPLPGE